MIDTQKYLHSLAQDFCKVFRYDYADLMQNTYKGTRELVDARSCFCYIARNKEFTTVELGQFFGRDHSTIVQHFKDFPHRLEQMEAKELALSALRNYNVELK
jgi:chromosomal replication initiation ATPase DnaA